MQKQWRPNTCCCKNDKSIEGIIQDKINGRIFSNDEELANFYLNYLQIMNLAKILAANVAKTIEEFSSESFAKIEEVYYSILQ